MDSRHKKLVAKAQRIMHEDPSAQWSISELAQACNTSPTVLKCAFKEEAGVPLYAWHRCDRIHTACRMMREYPTRPIAEIAAAVGYANPSKFASAFRTCLGCSPTAWRSSQSAQDK